MSHEIPSGSILEKRYKIIKILGKGGFGRAYLAEDSNRYNEHCVLKEFAPSIERNYWNKAKELFDRECSQLYLLNHDQIPAFRELLKAKVNNELYVFLVQNYVRGLNYHTIVQKYGVLNEGQIIYFLQQILPVLSYIHNQNLIHRDISPDNLICRFDDQKPVLIDFGLVKQFSTRYTQMAFTPAGKPWFSPYEQLQGYAVSPSSDLYALAVTVLFLLTNRSPADFYISESSKWEFNQHVTISAGLSKILTKMLEFRPVDRYQTAAEVSKEIAILPYINPVAILINQMDLDSIQSPNKPNPTPPINQPNPTPPINQPNQLSSFTDSILKLFHKADIWGILKSDFAKPIKYVGGSILTIFLVIVVLNWILQGIGSVMSSITKPQANSALTPITTSSPTSDSCLNINDRMKAAKISSKDVNKRFYQKYPDRRNKPLDRNNISDRRLIKEWCQIAETVVAENS
jgi:serine/threonine protein kinase